MMGKNSKSNILRFDKKNVGMAEPENQNVEVEDVSEFIVDMLDTMMKIAAKKEQSLLVYFLAMARIEAMEMKEEKPKV